MKAIPTLYKGARFKSRLEADLAFLLDAVGLAWKYEPQSYMLADGTHYLPDFWLPEVRLWIETRGYDSDKGNRQIFGFARLCATESTEYEVLRPGARAFFQPWDAEPLAYDPILARCRECGRWSFLPDGGDRHCRRCGATGEPMEDWHDVDVIDGHLCLTDILGGRLSVRDFVADLPRLREAA